MEGRTGCERHPCSAPRHNVAGPSPSRSCPVRLLPFRLRRLRPLSVLPFPPEIEIEFCVFFDSVCFGSLFAERRGATSHAADWAHLSNAYRSDYQRLWPLSVLPFTHERFERLRAHATAAHCPSRSSAVATPKLGHAFARTRIREAAAAKPSIRRHRHYCCRWSLSLLIHPPIAQAVQVETTASNRQSSP